MSGAMKTPRTAAQRNATALAGLRIAVGCLFLIFGQYKVFGTQFTLHGGFQGWIRKFIQDGAAYPFMIPVLTRFVLPHSTPIAFLAAYGELAIGLALVLGVWVRIASIFGLIYMLAFVLIKLPRSLRSSVGILRGIAGSLGPRPVLRNFHGGSEQRDFFHQELLPEGLSHA